MVALLQQLAMLLALMGGAAWLAWCLPAAPAAAVGGIALWVSIYAAVLAYGFLALTIVGIDQQVPRASPRQLIRAWCKEIGVSLRVYAWRQPWRHGAIPDHLPSHRNAGGPCGVVLVHGYLCNRGFWNPWLRMLREREHPFVAVSLEPVFGTIDAYVAPIEAAVRKLTALTGRPPVLVCHSMGGLAARAWARRLGVDPQGHTRSAAIISIGSPHAGTWMARFSSAHNCRQMRLQSQWLDQLGRSETSAMRRQMICWYSNCDNIVFPATSATLAGADNRLVTGVAHMALAFDLRVVQPSLAKIASL